MALQVWLPLNGNLNNQGLSNLSLTNNGAESDTDGKIGNCMKLSYAIDTGYSPNINSGSLSIGGWFKFNKSEIQTRLSTLTIDSRRTTPTGNLIGNHYYGGIGIIWTANNMNSSGGTFNSMNIFGHIRSNTLSYFTGNYVVQFDTWTHLFITFDINTRIFTFYVNGQCHSQVSIGDANDIPTTSIRLNVGWVYGGNGPGSSIPFRSNDVRIYDHCLSPKEVKEIAKGLVLHYKLDDPYVEETVNLGNTSTTYSNISEGATYTNPGSWGGTTGTITYYHSGGYNNYPYKVYHRTGAGSGGFYYKTANDISIEAGKTYTVSCYMKCSQNVSNFSAYSFNINRGSDNHYINCGGNFSLTTEWERKTYTFTANSSDAGMYGEMSIIYGGTSTDENIDVYYSGFQIEEKDRATPYTPSTRTASTTVYDCSGYGRNGTITGQSVSINNISPRYNYNLLATNTSNWSVITNSGFSLPDGPTTICFWSKPTVSATENTSRVQIDFGYFQYFTYINYPYLTYKTNRKYKYVNYWSDGNWHFVTGVYDGANLYIYVDGADVSSSSTTTTPIYYQNNLIIRLMGNNLSDFRIYSTALSADDIKELYDTSAYIYNDGSIAAYEFNEINTASRELHPVPTDNADSIVHNYDGSYTCSGKTWFHGDYIPINPSGKTYYYDLEYSNVEGNLFYIGFERYDANYDSGSNYGCRYIVDNSNAASRVRLTGTINLATALTGNPTAYTRLRILNNWNNSSDTSYKGTIHYISLKEVTTKTVGKVTKTGIFEGDTFIEDKDASISHTGNVIGNQIIEI